MEKEAFNDFLVMISEMDTYEQRLFVAIAERIAKDNFVAGYDTGYEEGRNRGRYEMEMIYG